MEAQIAERETWRPESEEDRMSPRLDLAKLVEIYQQSETEIRMSFARIGGAMGRLTNEGLGGRYLHLKTKYDRGGFDWIGQLDEVITELRRDVWRTLIDRAQLRRFMSIKAWDDLTKQIDDEEPPQISIENLEAMVAQFRDEAPAMLKAAVEEVFNFLRPPRSEYKTNTEFEIGERAVLNYYIEPGWSTWHIDYRHQQQLIALENVFRMVAGQLPREDGNHYSDLQAAIHALPRSKPCVGETEFFAFKGFKKGTLHLRFKRMDLVARLNAIAGGARLKPVNGGKS